MSTPALFRLSLLGLIALAVPALAQAPAPAPTADPLDARLALVETVHTGRLANGVTWFIRPNQRPLARASLRLAVRAGSVLEADNQQGLAHFLEHMNFNGTRHFKPGELISFMETIGARFGADANAYTSFDETVYQLDVPTDRPGLLDKALLALSDFAGQATLDPKEIDKERGVVLEEWRLGQGAAARMQRQQFPTLFHGSRYAERLPIGKPEILKSFAPERLHEFMRDYYRPDRMAVVIVGDVDPARAEALVKQHFAGLKGEGAGQPVPVFEIPSHRETLVNVATDAEARGTSVGILWKHPRPEQETVRSYRLFLLKNLLQSMINARLEDLARRPDAAFLGAFASQDSLGTTIETFSIAGRVADGGIEAGLAALLLEAERVRQHGFSAAELARAKNDLLAGYERAYKEREKSESEGYARELVSHFLEGEPAPGIVEEYRMAQDMVPGMTLGEVQELARTLVREDNRVVLATAPSGGQKPVPGNAEVLNTVAKVAATAVTPWIDTTAGKALVEHPPEGGRVTERRLLPELGVSVWKLSNGVEVWLKPTDFKNDQILFQGYAPGGLTLATPETIFDAMVATAGVEEEGVGGFTPADLEKLLSGKLANASLYVGPATHGISGGASPKDIETALQLGYLYFTQPNQRPEAFEVLRQRFRSGVAHQAEDPSWLFGQKVREVNTQGHYTSRPLTPQAVETLDRTRSRAFYASAFANAADFTFFFVGAFKPEELEPLVARYLGGLPSTGRRTLAVVDRGLAFPQGIHKATVSKGKEPKSSTTLAYFADTGLKEDEVQKATAAASLLAVRLRGLLREDMGGTYGVGVNYSHRGPLPGYGSMTISFGSAPANVAKLVDAAQGELVRLQAAGPPQQDVDKIKEIERRELETQSRQNGYWLSNLVVSHVLGWDAAGLLHRREAIDSLTREDLHQAFRRYFPADRYTWVSLYPEGETGAK